MSEDKILKVDALGRVRTSRKDREAVLDEFERSGLPGTRFAKRHGINYQTLATWIQKRKRARGEYPEATGRPATRAPIFALVEARAASFPENRPETEVLEIALPCGAKLSVGNEKQAGLAAVLLAGLNRAESC